MRQRMLSTAVIALFLLFLAGALFAHGDEKHKGKIKKVMPTQMVAASTDTSAEHSDENSEEHSEEAGEMENAAVERDVNQIITDTKNSTTATVIKVGSLFLAVAGLVVAYYPGKKSNSSDNENGGQAGGR